MDLCDSAGMDASLFSRPRVARGLQKAGWGWGRADCKRSASPSPLQCTPPPTIILLHHRERATVYARGVGWFICGVCVVRRRGSPPAWTRRPGVVGHCVQTHPPIPILVYRVRLHVRGVLRYTWIARPVTLLCVVYPHLPLCT